MGSCLGIIEKLIDELARSQQTEVLFQVVDGQPSFSGYVSIGEDRSLPLTHAMDALIVSLSKELKVQNPNLALTHTDKEWAAHVRTQIGPVLALVDLDTEISHSAQEVLAGIHRILEETKVNVKREFSFGCSLFSINDMPTMRFGPVVLESRLAFLQRLAKSNRLSKHTARRLASEWSGSKQRKRRASLDEWSERSIKDTIGDCDYVCSIVLERIAGSAGREKAQLAARLALLCVAIFWRQTSSALDGMNLLIDRTIRKQQTLQSTSDGLPYANFISRGNPQMTMISVESWQITLEKNSDVLAIFGEVLNYWVSADQRVSRPNLMQTLFHSLLWFHEACRSDTDIIAVVNFVAALDSLASGGQEFGIKKLINARLGIGADTRLSSNGETTSEVLKRIYRVGRSRTIHGTNATLGHDWAATRELCESLARHCICASFKWAAGTTSDDPKLLLVA